MLIMERKINVEKRIRKSGIEWTNESTIMLIENVKLNTNLWNPSDLQYRDRKAHEYSWTNISQTVEVSKEDAVNKWNAMRGNYRVFRKNQINEQPAGKKRPNVYFCKMSFLDPVLNLFETPSPQYKSNQLADNVSKPESEEESPKQKRRRIESHRLVPSSPRVKKNSLKETGDQDTHSIEHNVQQQKQLLPNWNHNNIIAPVPSTNNETIARRIVVGKDDDDEWSALGKMITTNARTWSTENMAFARSYKAELSAINAKFELQAAKMTHANCKNSSVTDVVHIDDGDT